MKMVNDFDNNSSGNDFNDQVYYSNTTQKLHE